MINNVWVVMGYSNHVDFTKRSIEQLVEVSDNINLLVINNGCKEEPLTMPVPKEGVKYPIFRMIFLYNEENTGCLPMLKQALPYMEDDDLLVFMHNDVLIWKDRWDEWVRGVFDSIPSLGLAGLFGAPGVAADGGRMFAKSTMLGKEWGTEGHLHGAYLEENAVAPASVIDSLCMIFRVSALKEVGVPSNWPPHHWFDRLFGAKFIENNWKVAVLGIPFDHYGGGSAGDVMDNFAIKWAKEALGEDLGPVEANAALYNAGLQIWNYDYAHRMSLITDGWDYIWRTHRQ